MASIPSLKERLFDRTSGLPAQVSLRHIIAISICSVVGTGVFISTLSTSLRRAGPAGVLIAYAVTSSIVYCTAVSNGEMMAHLPSVGGPVGLADVFVDPALGFAMGWNAWYHWTIIIPTQLAAAGRLVNVYISTDPTPKSTSLYYGSIAFFLVLAVCLNFVPAKRFGQIHVVFALLKMLTLSGVVLVALVIDWSPILRCNAFPNAVGCSSPVLACASEVLDPSSITVRLLGKYWRCPGPWVQPFGTKGVWGSILGVFTVLIQAAFSFFGTEIAGVPGREIQEPAKNIPRAIRRVWLRVTVLYTLAVIAAGLVVPANNPSLKLTPAVAGSPWIIALKTAYSSKTPQLVLSAFFILSAFSAASADIYVSSRYLFFLARRGHAPILFGSLFKGRPKVISPFKLSNSRDMREQVNTPLFVASVSTMPSASRPSYSHSREPSMTLSPASPLSSSSPTSELGLLHAQGHHRQQSYTFSIPTHIQSGQSSSSGTATLVPRTPQLTVSRPQTTESTHSVRRPVLLLPQGAQPSVSAPASLHSPISPQGPRALKRTKALGSPPPPDTVVPWVGVLAAAAISLVVFMAPAGQTHKSVNDAFNFLTQMTNCAALVAWVCILITYLRFYDGTCYQEAKDPEFRIKHAGTLYNNRPWGQPWLARYALGWCITILLGQGWSSFTSPGVKRIAELDGDPPIIDNPDIGDFDLAFIVSYLPLALFLLLAFGYKLVYQTKFVTLESMNFGSERRRTKPAITRDSPPVTVLDRIYEFLL